MKTSIIGLLLFIAGVTRTFGAEGVKFFENYNFSFLTEDAGLPNNFIDDMIKDSQGFIWLATHEGISRYDGYRFYSYDTQSTAFRLKSNFVHKLCEDTFGRLWIGTEAGLNIIDLQTYRTADTEKSLAQQLPELAGAYIVTIYQDSQQRLWIATNKDLWCLSFNKKGEIDEWHHLKQKTVSPVHAVIDLGDCICAGIDNNLYRIEQTEKQQLKITPFSEVIHPFTEDWRILCMAEEDDCLWIGTNRGLFRYHRKEKKLDRYRYSNHRPGMLSQAYITDIRLTAKKKVIVATLNGLNVYHPETDSFEYIRQNNASRQNSLNSNAIDCLLTQGEDIWAGTQTGGVNLLTTQCLQASVLPYPVNAIAEDAAGNLWVGIIENGLNKIDKDNHRFTTFKFDQRNPTSISNNTLTGLLIDHEDHLWAYTWGVGINELDLNRPGNTTFSRHLREDSLGLEGDFLSSACEDTLNKGIWFATTIGLHFYHKSTQRFTRVYLPEADNEFESVGTLLIDRKKRLWMPTSKGVFIVDLYSFTHSFQQLNYAYLKYRLSDPASQKQERINCVLQTSDGTIWLGADGNGLYKLTKEKGNLFEFENYASHNGLADNTVLGMVEDRSGLIWLTTGYGLSCLDPKLMLFTNYTQEDGLPSNQFYRNAYYYSARRDRLYFGTMNGMVAFNPQVEKASANDPSAVISALNVGGKRVYPPASADTLSTIQKSPHEIRLHEKEENFSVEFSTLNYGRQTRVRYAYRLKGHDKAWKETKPGQHAVQYAALPAGEYTLQIRATDDKGHWSQQVTEVAIVIQPYFYKTSWFLLLVVLVLGGSSYGIYRLRHRKATVLPPAPSADSLPSPQPDAPTYEAANIDPHSKDKEFMSAAYELMKKHYTESEYGVDNFVHDMGYSKTFINSKLQALTGNSIGQFMKYYRLTVAKEALEKEGCNSSVADIAYAVGFSDPKYFTKCFKDQFGILPSELLKKNKTT